jgi:glycosyltransferase involved in cell wall biosynthesis
LKERLTVLSVAYPFAHVGPDGVGGAEQVLSMIDEALVAAGHRSIVVACAGSTCAGELVTVPGPRRKIDAGVRRATCDLLRRTIDGVARDARVDVVHAHGVDFHEYLPRAAVPVLVTLHLPLSCYPQGALLTTRPRTWMNGVSASQMRSAPAAMRRVPEIPNGVRLDQYRPVREAKRRYAICLGRICPEKGFDLALEAAQQAGVPLLLAGRTFPYDEHERHFAERIAPRLRAGCHFIGAVGPARKRSLLGRARCLVVPSLIAETSSLAAMEALACGTPVVAFRNGALPDIVEHGRTGFVVDDVAAMAQALREVGDIDPRACREAAERRFSSSAMTNRYVQLHETLAEAPAALEDGWST